AGKFLPRRRRNPLRAIAAARRTIIAGADDGGGGGIEIPRGILAGDDVMEQDVAVAVVVVIAGPGDRPLPAGRAEIAAADDGAVPDLPGRNDAGLLIEENGVAGAVGDVGRNALYHPALSRRAQRRAAADRSIVEQPGR